MIDIDKICSFCGHRDSDNYLRKDIKDKILDLIENYCVNTFQSGGMGNFDHMCESVVREFKRMGKNVRLVLVAPYMTKQLNYEKNYYETMYDEIIIPEIENNHYKSAIPKRNKWLVEHSDVILSFIEHRSGGAYAMFKYAIKNNVIVCNLGCLKEY